MTIRLDIQLEKENPQLAGLPANRKDSLLLFSSPNPKIPHLLVEGTRELEIKGNTLRVLTDRAMVFSVRTQNLEYLSVPKVSIGSNGAVEWAQAYFNRYAPEHVELATAVQQRLGSRGSYKASNLRIDQGAETHIREAIRRVCSQRLPLVRIY